MKTKSYNIHPLREDHTLPSKDTGNVFKKGDKFIAYSEKYVGCAIHVVRDTTGTMIISDKGEVFHWKQCRLITEKV